MEKATVSSASGSSSDDVLTSTSTIGSESAENPPSPQNPRAASGGAVNPESASDSCENPDDTERAAGPSDGALSRAQTPFATTGNAQNPKKASDDAQDLDDVEGGLKNADDAMRGALTRTTGDAQTPETPSESWQDPADVGNGASKSAQNPIEKAILGSLASTTVLLGQEGDFEGIKSAVTPFISADNPEDVADKPISGAEKLDFGDRAGDEGEVTTVSLSGGSDAAPSDVGTAERRRTSSPQEDDVFAVSAVPVFRATRPMCVLCPVHASALDDSVLPLDDLSSVGVLSTPSNMDAYRTYHAFRSHGGVQSSDISGPPDARAEPTPSTSVEPTPTTSYEPTPSTSFEPTPSTSREPPRRQEGPFTTTVISVSPSKSSGAGIDSDQSFPIDTSRNESAIRSLIVRILDRCCCGMGMKLHCFEGNSGANSYFLLENLGTDKDSSTEKQEELQFFDDNGSYVSVVVEKNLRAIDLTQLLAVKNRVRKDYCWSIVEHWVEIGTERVLEDHEDVLSVHRQTEGGAKKYIFRRFPNKYDFFSKPEGYFPPDMIDLKTYLPGFMYPEKHPEQLERVLTTAEELPVIFSQVNLRQECDRNIWVKTFLLLKDSKILMSSKVQVVAKFLRAWRETSTGYRPLEGDTSIDHDDGLEQYVAIGEGNEEELEVLADLKDYEVYTSLNAKNQLKGPTEFGVVLRKTNEEDFADPVVLSFDKGKDRVCWVTAMRLAKYGKQLRENYKAFKNKQETISTNGSTGNINESVRSRVAMDFTGKVGRIVDDPMEAKAIAVSEGNAWKKRLRAKAESSRCAGVTLEAGEEEKSHHSQPWFHKNMSREQASALLSAHAKHDGVFVVRGSRSQPGGNVLSFKSQEKVIHLPIMMVEDPLDKIMCYTIDNGTTKFYDICQLVEFYRLNSGPLPTRLSNHLEKLPQVKTPGTSAKTETH